MRFDALEAFIVMDGHGVYVWLAYVITFGVLSFTLWWPRQVRHRIIAEQQRVQARAGGSSG